MEVVLQELDATGKAPETGELQTFLWGQVGRARLLNHRREEEAHPHLPTIPQLFFIV